MSRKYAGNDFENRRVFSRWRNVDNDWADDTSACKSFKIRGTTTVVFILFYCIYISRRLWARAV